MSPLVLTRPRGRPHAVAHHPTRPPTRGSGRTPRSGRTRRTRRLLLLAALLTLLATGCNVRGMGAGFSGQIGDGTKNTRTTPVTVTGDATFAQVSAGADHTCGITRQGALQCWGENRQGQLGLGPDETDRTEPTQVGTATDWRAVSAGETHTCGIRGDERLLFCWGRNASGQTVPSGGSVNPVTRVPTLVTPDGGFAEVSTGRIHSCAVKLVGVLLCWGGNSDGRLGAGDRENPDVLRQVAGTWRSVSAAEHTCATKFDNTLHCWGPNDRGQLGTGDLLPGLSPRQVVSPVPWGTVDTGSEHTCAIAVDDVLHCWGESGDGQLGLGTTTDRLVPNAVQPRERWTQVSAGTRHTCGIRRDATAFCWGEGLDGQLGVGTTIDRLVPVRVEGIGDDGADLISAGRKHTHVQLPPAT